MSRTAPALLHSCLFHEYRSSIIFSFLNFTVLLLMSAYSHHPLRYISPLPISIHPIIYLFLSLTKPSRSPGFSLNSILNTMTRLLSRIFSLKFHLVFCLYFAYCFFLIIMLSLYVYTSARSPSFGGMSSGDHERVRRLSYHQSPHFATQPHRSWWPLLPSAICLTPSSSFSSHLISAHLISSSVTLPFLEDILHLLPPSHPLNRSPFHLPPSFVPEETSFSSHLSSPHLVICDFTFPWRHPSSSWSSHPLKASIIWCFPFHPSLKSPISSHLPLSRANLFHGFALFRHPSSSPSSSSHPLKTPFIWCFPFHLSFKSTSHLISVEGKWHSLKKIT